MGTDPANTRSLVEFAQGRLTSEVSLEVLELVESNSDRSAELETVIDILDAVENATLFSDDPRESRSSTGLSIRGQHPLFGSAIRAAALVVALIGAVLIAQEVTKPEMLSLAHVDPQDFDFRTRGEGKQIIEVAFALLAEGEYDRAMTLVDWSLSTLPKGDDRAQAHLLKGGLLLMRSEKYTVGFFSHYDTTLVRLALEELVKARRDSDQRIVLETSLWLGIKSNLILGNKTQALEQARQLHTVGGIRHAEAIKLHQLLSEH